MTAIAGGLNFLKQRRLNQRQDRALVRAEAATMQLDWGARPPRAQWDAPSRPARRQGIYPLVSVSGARAFGARARRTTAGAAVLPGYSTAWLRRRRIPPVFPLPQSISINYVALR